MVVYLTLFSIEHPSAIVSGGSALLQQTRVYLSGIRRRRRAVGEPVHRAYSADASAQFWPDERGKK